MYSRFFLFLSFSAALDRALAQSTEPNLYKVTTETIIIKKNDGTKPAATVIKKDAASANASTLVYPVKKDSYQLKQDSLLLVDSAYKRKGLAPNLSVKISLDKVRVRSFEDLKLNIVVTNTSSRNQKFLFDKPSRAGLGPWATNCIIYNSKKDIVVKYYNKGITESLNHYSDSLRRYKLELDPKDWIMKTYYVKDMVSLHSPAKMLQSLDPGIYTMQISIWGNLSNSITFTIY